MEMRVVTGILVNQGLNLSVFKVEDAMGGPMQFYEMPRYIGPETIGVEKNALQKFLITEQGEQVTPIPDDELEGKISEWEKQEGWKQCDFL